MAGDWIKVETCTPDKPEVYQLAETLGIDPDAITGKLLRIWVWADQQTFDGNAGSVTKTLLDRITGVSGFAEAMLKVGWLEKTDAGFRLPNFDRHNGNTAKSRALSGKRVAKHRSKPAEKCNGHSVTKSLPEKRREESIYIEPPCEVIIPEKMQTEKVQEYFRTWMAHLELQYPEKVPMQNSPQLEMFWAEAARMGPDRFCESVQYSTANNWATLHERHVKENGKGKAAASYPDDLLKICTVCKQHPQEPAKRREILGPKLHEISRRLDVQTILSSIGDDWKMKSLNQFYGQHLKDLECKTT